MGSARHPRRTLRRKTRKRSRRKAGQRRKGSRIIDCERWRSEGVGRAVSGYTGYLLGSAVGTFLLPVGKVAGRVIAAGNRKAVKAGRWFLATDEQGFIGSIGRGARRCVHALGGGSKGALSGRTSVGTRSELDEEASEVESELIFAREQMEQAHERADQARARMCSQLNVVQKERLDLLVSDLGIAGGEAGQAWERVSALESALAEREGSLEGIHDRTDKLKAEMSSGAGSSTNDDAAVLSDTDEQELETDEPLVCAGEEQVGFPVGQGDIQSAVFSKTADKIILERARSDLFCRTSDVRAAAVKTIATIRHEISLKILTAQFGRERSARVRQEIVKALEFLGMKQGLPMLESALEDPVASVRLDAVWATYRLAGDDGSPSLAWMLSDEDDEVRRRAATCMGWMGREKLDRRQPFRRLVKNESIRQLVAPLIKCLDDPEKSVRTAVLGALEMATGKKMGSAVPRDDVSYQRLVVRWREWWKEEGSDVKIS